MEYCFIVLKCSSVVWYLAVGEGWDDKVPGVGALAGECHRVVQRIGQRNRHLHSSVGAHRGSYDDYCISMHINLAVFVHRLIWYKGKQITKLLLWECRDTAGVLTVWLTKCPLTLLCVNPCV